MPMWRIAVYVVAALIVATTLATGPLVGAVELPAENQGPTIGTGNATVSVTYLPDTVTIEAGERGTDAYYLEVPAATVEVSELRGNPILDYSIQVDGFGYSRGSIHLLGELGEGPHSITLERDSFESGQLDQGQYDAVLSLTLRGDSEQMLVERNVTVEVEE
jgi:hypothetical protein